MAINPGSYPFSGGVHHGSNDNVSTDDIYPLTVKQGGQEVGQYNPLTEPGTEIEIPEQLSAQSPIKIVNKKITNNGTSLTCTGTNAWAEGKNTKATANFAHAEGESSEAKSNAAHAEGTATTASGLRSHAEGFESTASGESAHAEGGAWETDQHVRIAGAPLASGDRSHAEGCATTAEGRHSHAEGETTTAHGNCSHSEGYYTTASGNNAHAEGNCTSATSDTCHAEGLKCKANGLYSHAEGNETETHGKQSHAEGYGGIAHGESSHVEGSLCVTTGMSAHAEGGATLATGKDAHAEGYGATNVKYSNPQPIAATSGTFTIPDGVSTSGAKYICVPSIEYLSKIVASAGPTLTCADTVGEIVPVGATVILVQCGALGYNAHCEGYSTLAEGGYSHAEGSSTKAIGSYSHTEGYGTDANGDYGHAEGSGTHATGSYSHAEGSSTTAGGTYSHAEGYDTTAAANFSHAGGLGTVANSDAMSAIGKFNSRSNGLFVVGNGTADDARSDAFWIDADGAMWQTITDMNGTARLMKITGGIAKFEMIYGGRVGNWTYTNVKDALDAGLYVIILNHVSNGVVAPYIYAGNVFNGTGHDFNFITPDGTSAYWVYADNTDAFIPETITATFTEDGNGNWTCDKTYAEIRAKIDTPNKLNIFISRSGLIVKAPIIATGTSADPTLHFYFFSGTHGTHASHVLNMANDGTISFDS